MPTTIDPRTEAIRRAIGRRLETPKAPLEDDGVPVDRLADLYASGCARRCTCFACVMRRIQHGR